MPCSGRQFGQVGASASAPYKRGKLRRPGIKPLASGHVARERRTQVRGLWGLRFPPPRAGRGG